MGDKGWTMPRPDDADQAVTVAVGGGEYVSTGLDRRGEGPVEIRFHEKKITQREKVSNDAGRLWRKIKI